jgi:hypothetical protein
MPILSASSEKYWLRAIIVVAVLLRVAAAFYLGNKVVDSPGTFDQISYDMLAQQVVGGHGLTVAQDWWPNTPAGEPTAHWSYLYTFYLVIIYYGLGYQPLLARLIQAAIAGILMPWLAYRLSSRYFDSMVGLVTAGITAVYFYFVYYAAALMSETFYIISILWVLDVAGQMGDEKTRAKPKSNLVGQGLLLGVALAVTILLRQVFLLFIPFLFMWLLWRSHGHSLKAVFQMMLALAIATFILILAVAPWTYRNYRAFDQFVLLNTNAGFAFFWGNHPIHGYNFIPILPNDGPSYNDLIPAELKGLNEAELDRALLGRGLGFIREEPGRYLILSLTRFRDYFKFWPSTDSELISNIARVLSFGILWPFMLYGSFLGLRRNLLPQTLLLYLFVVVYTGIHVLTWTLIRYRLPVDAVLMVFAGAAVVKIYTKLLSYTQPRVSERTASSSLHSRNS